MSILFLLLFIPKNCPFSREFEGNRPGGQNIRASVNFIIYTGYSCRKRVIKCSKNSLLQLYPDAVNTDDQMPRHSGIVPSCPQVC
jgi:hypothetical protein